MEVFARTHVEEITRVRVPIDPRWLREWLPHSERIACRPYSSKTCLITLNSVEAEYGLPTKWFKSKSEEPAARFAKPLDPIIFTLESIARSAHDSTKVTFLATSSGSLSSRRSWVEKRIGVKTLFKSWAIPPASVPRLSRR